MADSKVIKVPTAKVDAVERSLAFHSASLVQILPLIPNNPDGLLLVNVDEDLLGANGTFKNNTPNIPCVIEARNDWEAIQFILKSANNKNTQRAYRRDIEKLLLWAWLECGKPISSLDADDYMAFYHFMLEPPADWCVDKKPPRIIGLLQENDSEPTFKLNTLWRPYRLLTEPEQKLWGIQIEDWLKASEATDTPPERPICPFRMNTAKQAIIIIKSMVNRLHKVGYLLANPFVCEINISSPDMDFAREALTNSEKNLVIRTIEGLPNITDKEKFIYARYKWTFQLILGLGLRIFEAANGNMGQFHSAGNKRWQFNVDGKGGKKIGLDVPLNLIQHLNAWREACNYPVLGTRKPILEDRTPLVERYSARRMKDTDGSYIGKHLSVRQLSNLIQDIFEKAKKAANDAGNPVLAARFDAFSPHYLRHTAITAIGEIGDVRDQQAFARLADMNSITIYNTLDKKRLEHNADAMYEGMWVD